MYRSLKKYLIFAGLAIIAVFLVYTQYMVRELGEETETTSKVYGRFCADITQDETSIIFDEIVKKINFPVIVTSPDGIILSARNVKTPSSQMITKLDNEHPPVKIEYEGKTLALVHYGNTRAQKLLNFISFTTVLLSIILVIIGAIWFYTLKRDEENAIFVGLAKEAAHQLGTPVSSLLGWKEFLRDKEIEPLFSEDVERISKIVNRFHKLGFPPELGVQPISEIINPVVEYLEKRVSRKVKIEKKINNWNVRVDKELFSWALENLIKNAVDAGSTDIEISAQNGCRYSKRAKWGKITIKDNGKGIPQNVQKKMFIPGYTTKEYGWGMGLSLVKRIVRMHNGKIFYIPKRQEKGSVFTIYIPVTIS